MYHLWWHPHNFGINQLENFAFLEEILVHYRYLNEKYGFTSCTMSELAHELIAVSQTLTNKPLYKSDSMKVVANANFPENLQSEIFVGPKGSP